MSNKFKKNDLVRVEYLDGYPVKELFGYVGWVDEDKNIVYVDLNLDDNTEDLRYYTGISFEDCHKLTKEEIFKHKLQGKGVGLYG